MDPPGQFLAVTVRGGSDLGTFAVGAVEPAGIGRQARRRPITWKFCFGAVPYTVQRHDCRGIFAGTAARVHAIGGGMMRAAVAAMITGRMPGFSCARTQTVVPRRSICSDCDRGHIYCADCAPHARRRSLHAAGRALPGEQPRPDQTCGAVAPLPGTQIPRPAK